MGQAAVMHSHVACAARHRAPACRWAGRRRRQGPQHGGVMHGGGAATRGMQGRWAACKGGPGRRRLHLRVPTPGSARTMCLLRRRLPAQHAQIGRRLLLLGLGSSGAAGARPAAPLVLQAVHQTAGGSGDQLGSPWRQPVRRWGRPARRPHGAANKEPRLLSQGCDCGAALAAGTRCVARAWERRRSAGSAAQGAGARPARARHQPERTPPPASTTMPKGKPSGKRAAGVGGGRLAHACFTPTSAAPGRGRRERRRRLVRSPALPACRMDQQVGGAWTASDSRSRHADV